MTIEKQQKLAKKIIMSVLQDIEDNELLRVVHLNENNNTLQIVWDSVDGITNNLIMEYSLSREEYVGLDAWSKTFEGIQ